jgi:hypothetical protein
VHITGIECGEEPFNEALHVCKQNEITLDISWLPRNNVMTVTNGAVTVFRTEQKEGKEGV